MGKDKNYILYYNGNFNEYDNGNDHDTIFKFSKLQFFAEI